LSSDQKLVLASANVGKIKELQGLLGGLGFTIVPQTDLNIPDVDETGLTFVENAILKARNATALSNLPAVADDSGLEVDYLQGAPGIYSARFAGEGATDTANREKLLDFLVDAPADQRTARYQTVIVYMAHANDPTPIICQALGRASSLGKSEAMAVLAMIAFFMCRNTIAAPPNSTTALRTVSVTAAKLLRLCC
jgi:XTP/dITP diphosphohydrolase